jgi:hypothetical protein
MKTYQGWTEKEIEEAELNGDYIPSSVMIDLFNDDFDGANED